MAEVLVDIAPLESLLADGSITAIHIAERDIRYEKAGQLHIADIDLGDDTRQRLIMSILAACGQTLSAGHSVADGVLADGTRVHAELSPLSLSLYKAT